MPTWNPQQKKAIETRNKNILVSASAGAGKTTVLIARLVDLVLKEGISLDHILAMTFTEAAANEMKKRLAFELDKRLSQSTNETEKQYIANQLSALQTAHISTIHSFCLSILQEHYYTIGLSANMVTHILDDAQANAYKKRALQKAFDHQYQTMDHAFVRLTMMFSPRAENDTQLSKAIIALASLANAKSDPQSWLSDCLHHYQDYTSIKDVPKPIKTLFFHDLSIQTKLYQEACDALFNHIHIHYQDKTKKLESMQQKCDAIPPLQDAIHEENYNEFRQRFIALCHIVPPTSPDKSDTSYDAMRKTIITMEDTWLERLYEESILLHDIKELKEPLRKLIDMCKHYLQEFADIKRKQECIDFDDMEHFSLRILKANDHEIAKQYQELFDEIMVDEFQDSNDVQQELIQLICRDNNVFRVGDIKQSIYGFRHAKPKLMRDMITYATDKDEVLYLSHNYRSKKTIVDFNNALFKELMNLSEFHCSYTKEDDVKIGIPQQEVDNTIVQFHALHTQELKEESDLILSNDEWKASYIASQIISMHRLQNRQWKDFVVLVRSNAKKQDLRQAFDEVHIPYFIDVKTGFYQSSAVSTIISHLYACMDPYDDLHFVAVMTSYMYQISVEELSKMKLDPSFDHYYSYMKRIQHPAWNVFETIRIQQATTSICDMLSTLYDVNNYYQEGIHVQERTNLDLLFEHALNFEKEKGQSVLAFLHELETLTAADSGEAIPIGSEDDVVRVMSIHQSKGLQFPIVFLWSNSKQTPIEFHDLCIFDDELGIAMQYMDQERCVRKTLFRMAMEHKKDMEELEEEMRILYVATTRAQQEMHIVDTIRSMKDYETKLSGATVFARGGYSAWFLHSQLAHEPNPLFVVKEILHMWNKETEPAIDQKHIKIAYYDKATPSFAQSSPSMYKTAIPKLTFQKNDGMEYGTLLHQWVEKLPDRFWQMEDYEKLDANMHFHERHALEQLNQNQLFQTTRSFTQIYHELPFMIQKDQDIVHGYMDYVAINESTIIIIDFKSDALSKESQFLSLYYKQLMAYEDAMHQIYPYHKIESYLYSFHLHKEIFVRKKEHENA